MISPKVACLLLFTLFAASSHAAPDAQEILSKFIANAEDEELARRRAAIAYQRASRVEYLNEDGTVERNVMRIYKVFPQDGQTVTRLVSVNGRPAKDKTDKAPRKRSAARETGERSRSLSIDGDLLSRFDFTLAGEETFAGRRVWVLAFVPKADAPSEEFFDKFINAMAGKLWIDQEEYQLAKAEVNLSKRIGFFGGLAGALDKLNLTLIQRRVEPSVWIAEATNIDCSGRKLFSTMRFRAFENCSEFQKIPTEHAKVELPDVPELQASP